MNLFSQVGVKMLVLFAALAMPFEAMSSENEARDENGVRIRDTYLFDLEFNLIHAGPSGKETVMGGEDGLLRITKYRDGDILTKELIVGSDNPLDEDAVVLDFILDDFEVVERTELNYRSDAVEPGEYEGFPSLTLLPNELYEIMKVSNNKRRNRLFRSSRVDDVDHVLDTFHELKLIRPAKIEHPRTLIEQSSVSGDSWELEVLVKPGVVVRDSE